MGCYCFIRTKRQCEKPKKQDKANIVPTPYFLSAFIWELKGIKIKRMRTFQLIKISLLIFTVFFTVVSCKDDEDLSQTNIAINVPTAGDLPKITKRRDFEELKLTGYLNGTDINAIREMHHLKYLDISEAHIVAGGDKYNGSYSTEYNMIGDCMFEGCAALKQILLPNSVTTIGNSAFGYCSSLTSINIPDGVTTIGRHAFFDCASLTNINIPNSVTIIGEDAFNGCTSLTSINISNGVTIIGDGAFFDCASLTSINIPNSVTIIGGSAFGSCASLTSINIPNGVIRIGDGAFSYCASLTSINIPDGVTTIYSNTFNGCTSLAIVKIGKGIDNISYTGLLENASIKKVYCYSTVPPKSRKDDFTGIVKSEAELYVPKGTYQAYFLSNWGTAFDNIIEMED